MRMHLQRAVMETPNVSMALGEINLLRERLSKPTESGFPTADNVGRDKILDLVSDEGPTDNMDVLVGGMLLTARMLRPNAHNPASANLNGSLAETTLMEFGRDYAQGKASKKNVFVSMLHCVSELEHNLEHFIHRPAADDTKEQRARVYRHYAIELSANLNAQLDGNEAPYSPPTLYGRSSI